MKLMVNQKSHEVEVDGDTPLLWVLREQLGLRGTHFGCGMGLCGACTVHLDGVAARTCVLPVAAVGERSITTIEGLGPNHPVQQAWIAEQVPQCGYCQSGQIMSAAALVATNRSPSDAQIREGMTNLCRCGTYDRIRKGVARAAAAMGPLALPPPPVEAPSMLPPGAPAPVPAPSEKSGGGGR